MSIANFIIEILTLLGTGAVVAPHIPDKFRYTVFLVFVVGTVLIFAHDIKDVYKDIDEFLFEVKPPKPKDSTGQEEKDFFEHHHYSIQGMNEYKGKYPNGKYVEDANYKIKTLAEEATIKGEEILLTSGRKSRSIACDYFKTGAENGITRATVYFSKCQSGS